MRDEIFYEYEKAKALDTREKYNEAIAIYRKILEKDPDNNIVKFSLAKDLKYMSDFSKEAEVLFKEIANCDTAKNQKLAVFELGRIAYRRRNYEKAKMYYNSLLGTESEIHALLELAKCDGKLRNIDEARKRFEELLLMNNHKKTPSILTEYGRFEARIRNYDKAESLFNRLYGYNIDKYNKTADFEIAKIAVKRKNYDKAKKILLPLFKEGNYNYNHVASLLGKIEAEEGNIDKAKDYYKLLLDKDGRAKSIGLLELGKIEYDRDNYNEATKYFEALKTIDDVSKSQALLNLGRIKTREGRYLEAREYFSQLTTFDKRSQSYAYLELGRIELYNENYEEALAYFDKVELEESEPFVALELAKIDVFKEDYETAKAKYRELLTLDQKTRAFACHGLINIALREPNYEEALYYLNEAVKTNVFSKVQHQRIKDFICFQLGLTDEPGFIGPYYYSLLKDYSKEKVIKHITDKLDENDDILGNASFLDSIDYSGLYDIAEEQIKDRIPLKAMLADVYIIPLEEEIGFIGDKKTTAIRVATFPASKKIVAIYPYPDDLCKIKKDIIK